MRQLIAARFSHLEPRTWVTMGNVVAGVSVGAYLIPQAMAYGSLAGVGASIGLATAIVPLLAYAILGTHKWMSVGPESAVALMAAAAAGAATQSTGLPPTIVLPTMAALVGVFMLIGRVLKAAFLADLLSLPVLLGYLSGIAILMVISQLPKLTGINVNTDDIITTIFETQWTAPDWPTLIVGLLVAAVAWGLPRFSPKIPGALIALAVAIVFGIITGIPTIGPVDNALPSFAVPNMSLDLLSSLAWPAATVAAVAFADVMITGRAISDGKRVNSGREMVALGGAQLATGFFSGYPASASSSRTALARASGATSKHYSLIVAAMLIFAPLLLSGVLAKIPQAGLAGIILYAAITLIDIGEWKKVAQLHRNELAIAVSCMVAVLLFGILPGIGFAIAASIFAFLARLARPNASVLGFTPMSASMHSVDTHDHTKTIPGLVVFRYEAPLFFINVSDFFAEAVDAVQEDTEVLLVNMEASPNLDTTSLDTLQELAEYLHDRGVQLWLARTRFDVEELLEKHGAMDTIGTNNIYETLGTAVESYQRVHPS